MSVMPFNPVACLSHMISKDRRMAVTILVSSVVKCSVFLSRNRGFVFPI